MRRAAIWDIMDVAELHRLAELVRQGERLLEQQLRLSEGQDEKSRHLITTATGFLTAAAAFAGFLGRDLAQALLVPFVCGLLAGFALLGLALALFARAYTGSRGLQTELDIGWAPELLEVAASDGDRLAAIHRSTLRGTTIWFRHNERALGRSANLRRLGMAAMLAAGALFVISLIYAVIAHGT